MSNQNRRRLQSHRPAMTQVPSVPRVPIALDTRQLASAHAEAMKRMKQVDPNSIGAVDMLGVSYAQRINSMLE